MTTTSSSPNNSWAATRAAERRATRELEARLAREDADAAARRRIEAETARGEKARADRDATEQRRATRAQDRAAARAARRARALTWANTHAVELLIYPIALLSFALAAPAMAAYGTAIFGATGFLLAGITELGMWAFAFAVTASRHRHPERPVLGLQAGVIVFSLIAAGLNLVHGLEQGWTTGLVMAVVSIAGVAAHQLTLAGAPRSRAQRRAARLTALVAVKTDRAQRLAIHDAAAVISPDGTAELRYRPGTYQVHRRALTTTTVPSTAPTPPVPTGTGDDWDQALAALVDCLDSRVDSTVDDDHGSGVDLLDHKPAEPGRESRPDQQQSTPPRSSSRDGVDPDSDLEPVQSGRTLDDLRGLLRDAINAGVVDPGSAESIRRALRCSAHRARHLRDTHRTDQQDGGERR